MGVLQTGPFFRELIKNVNCIEMLSLLHSVIGRLCAMGTCECRLLVFGMSVIITLLDIHH